MEYEEKKSTQIEDKSAFTLKRSSVGKNDLATAKTLDKRTGSLSLKP